MNVALLIIDVQKEFIGHLNKEKVFIDTMEYINETAELFREAKKPVIIIRDIEGGDSEDRQNLDELIVQDSDVEILKIYSNSFWKTDLEGILRDKSIDFVVISGNAAEYCVLATYNGAKERGFGAAMLQHGIFAKHKGGLLDIYNNRSMISYEVISYILQHDSQI